MLSQDVEAVVKKCQDAKQSQKSVLVDKRMVSYLNVKKFYHRVARWRFGTSHSNQPSS